MKKLSVLIIALSAWAGIAAQDVPQTNAKGQTLVWHDEFSTPGRPDSTRWDYEIGFIRNNEPQWYQPQNATVDDGLLIIRAKADPADGSLTSSSLITDKRMAWQYGSLEVRARIPVASGAWPAIWMKGIEDPWPSCGEIDILEYYRVDTVPTILANACWGSDKPRVGRWRSTYHPYSRFLERDRDWAEKFHVWRADWTPDYFRIYLDDELLNDIPLSETINGSAAAEGVNPFRRPMHLLLNLALRDRPGEQLDRADSLPMTYEIDYVRLYQSPGDKLIIY